MKSLPKLIFPKTTLKLRGSGDSREVLDTTRGRWLKLTPEEWVRRHVLAWLENQGYQKEQIVQEYTINLNSQSQRADIVVVDNTASPRILVECKAPEIAIDDSTLDQAVRYNSQLGAERIILTNGVCIKVFSFDGTRYRLIHEQ